MTAEISNPPSVVDKINKISHLWSLKASWAVLSNDWEVAAVGKPSQVHLTDIDKWSNHPQITLPVDDMCAYVSERFIHHQRVMKRGTE